MSVRDNNKKICVQGNIGPNINVIRYSDKCVNCDLPLWQLNIIEAINEKLDNENGCSVWFSYMKD